MKIYVIILSAFVNTKLSLKNTFICKGLEPVSLSLVELVLELDPVESERVEEALHHVHAHQHSKRCRSPHHVPHHYLNR